VSSAARFMLTVSLVRGTKSRAEARLGLLVQVAGLGTQVFDDGRQLGTRLEKFEALGNQRGFEMPIFLVIP
jgi:hypothetical protein